MIHSLIGSIPPAKCSIQPLEHSIRGVFEVMIILSRYDKDVDRDGNAAMGRLSRKRIIAAPASTSYTISFI